MVAWAEDEVAGQVISYLRRDGSGEMLEVSVHPQHQGACLGRALVVEAMRRLHLAGARRLWVSTRLENVPALTLYRDLGFSIETRHPRWRKTPS